MDHNLETKPWWDYVEEDIRGLLQTCFFLKEVVLGWGADLPAGKKVIHDYSFMVFPAAKAYEGFLKKVFLDMGFIDEADYRGTRFRIGKALNPFLEKEYRSRESVYDKIVAHCGGKELADILWKAWKEGRNLVFHWFPDEEKVISYEKAKEKINLIVHAMDEMFSECKL